MTERAQRDGARVPDDAGDEARKDPPRPAPRPAGRSPELKSTLKGTPAAQLVARAESDPGVAPLADAAPSSDEVERRSAVSTNSRSAADLGERPTALPDESAGDSAVIGRTLPVAPRMPDFGSPITAPVAHGKSESWAGMPSLPGSTTVSSRPPPGYDRRDDLMRVDPLIGLVIAERYRIIEPLGRGGMGIVYKVEHTRIGKLLAMKLLAGELSQNPEVVKRFKHEALTVSKLSSPNTVQVFDYGVSEGLTYLVMELVNGGDLGKVLRSHDVLGAAELGRIIVQVCNSLSEAHQKGIVHRDIKPENIMIARARDDVDFAKVLDFGLAKLREGSELNELTSQGAIVGTPYFMSPEQVKGEEVDARSDIYSLGAVMYRALTGQYAFNGPTPMAVFAKHLTENPIPPIDRAPERDIPRGFSDIVMRTLAKDPNDRFLRVEDLQSAIVAELADLGASGIESLLDSSALKRLAVAPGHVAEGTDPVPAPVATRDELEAYERKLRRRRWIAYAVLLVIPAAMIAGGVNLYHRYRANLGKFSGSEVEPNDTAARANVVPFGSAVNGMIGKRMSATQADLDIYAIEVPAGTNEVSLSVTPLPNMALCTQVYRKGDEAPLARFCPGRPALALDVPRLRLEPGPYLVSVTEDMNPYEDDERFLLENVSDEYSLTLAAGSGDVSRELEPNDSFAGATPVDPGKTVDGTIGWVSDKDFICAAHLDAAKRYRFRVSDDGRTARDGVLAVAPYAGGEGPMVRVHTRESPKMKSAEFSQTDRKSPYLGVEITGAAGGCVIVSESVDPFDGRPGAIPRGNPAKYHVTLEEMTK